MIAQAPVAAAAEGISPGSFETAWKIGGVWAVVSLALVGVVIFLFRKYDAEKTARINDARAYGDAQRAMNEQTLPYVTRITRRLERIERATADSDTPPALRTSLSRLDLGEDTESKGPNR